MPSLKTSTTGSIGTHVPSDSFGVSDPGVSAASAPALVPIAPASAQAPIPSASASAPALEETRLPAVSAPATAPTPSPAHIVQGPVPIAPAPASNETTPLFDNTSTPAPASNETTSPAASVPGPVPIAPAPPTAENSINTTTGTDATVSPGTNAGAPTTQCTPQTKSIVSQSQSQSQSHPVGSTGRTETVKGGPLGIRVISKNKIIYINHVEEDSKLARKVCVGDRITHINGSVIWDMKPSVFAKLLTDSTKKINGRDQVCRLTLQSPAQVKAQVQKMQQMQAKMQQSNHKRSPQAIATASVTAQGSHAMDRGILNSATLNRNFGFHHTVTTTRPYPVMASSLANTRTMPTNASNRGGRNVPATAAPTAPVPISQLPPPTNQAKAQAQLLEKILFAGRTTRKHQLMLIALAAASQEKLFQNKWMHTSNWCKILKQNYNFANTLHFTENELLDAIKSNRILKQEMDRTENICGMFLTKYKGESDGGHYIACMPLLASSSPKSGSNLKKAVMIKAPLRSVKQCLEDPNINIDVSKMKFGMKKNLPPNFVQRALSIEETTPRKAPISIPRPRMIDPLCDELRNGPPLPHGASVYWDSLEARKYFGATKEETCLDAIQRNLYVLRKALSVHDGYKNISRLETDEENAQMTPEQVYDVRIQIQAVISVYAVAFEKMPQLGIVKCCELAEKKMALYYNRELGALKLRKWFNEYKQSGKITVKQKKQQKSKKRKRVGDSSTTRSSSLGTGTNK